MHRCDNQLFTLVGGAQPRVRVKFFVACATCNPEIFLSSGRSRQDLEIRSQLRVERGLGLEGEVAVEKQNIHLKQSLYMYMTVQEK